MKKIIPILLLLISCCENMDPKPNIVVPTDINYCKAGCEHIANLPGQDGKKGCLESRDLIFPDGGKESCEEFCISTEKNGRAIEPKCWVNLQSCDQIETCRTQ